jgi:cytochrome c553
MVMPDITPDLETGIGKWTEAEIVVALRDGKRPDGSVIGPPMPIPVYRLMSDHDAKAIAAYLRSLKPVKNAQQTGASITAGPSRRSAARPRRTDHPRWSRV